MRNAYTDSVLFSLPVITKGPKGGDLVDLSPVFMSDLPQISQVLPGFMFSPDQSTWDSVKGFKDNVELQVAAVYASGGRVELDTVPDSRGATIIVHYSISKIPSTGYKPRVADDRVGYFLTVVKDFSKKDTEDQFVRYINRWHLQKADPAAEKSPPKEPFIFWIEKTVPFEYRKPIRDGIPEWNKAFEKAGFVDAIEVRQQPDDADWDPEDINYNTFRWITANAGFAMGPSRVNPYTGQILDADIIFDADFLTFWKQEFETLTPAALAAMTGVRLAPDLADLEHATVGQLLGGRDPHRHCCLSHGMSTQLAFGAAALMAEGDAAKASEKERELIMQGLKEVTMHEVGHTLGLRHNFKGSTYRNLKDINDVAKTREGGMVASVMDYNPTNIVPKGVPQGDFYPTTIGPYDLWAIEYGYKQFSGSEEEELKKIASRSGEPALKYATDEDTLGIVDADPESNRFDLGDDALEYAKQRAELMKQLIPGLVERSVKDGEDYTKARKAFNVILGEYGQAMQFAARYVGGLYTSRSHKGDKDGKPPFTVVDAKKQRDALALLEQQVLSDKPFPFPPELYNQLASSNWLHWGTDMPLRKDFAVHDLILMWQEAILSQLLSLVTLERIHDAELKVPADQGCADDGRTDRPRDQGGVRRGQSHAGRELHRTQAGDLQPPPQPAAELPADAVESGDGPEPRPAGLPDHRLRQADRVAGRHREAAGRQGQAGRLLQRAPPRVLRPHPEGAGGETVAERTLMSARSEVCGRKEARLFEKAGLLGSLNRVRYHCFRGQRLSLRRDHVQSFRYRTRS